MDDFMTRVDSGYGLLVLTTLLLVLAGGWLWRWYPVARRIIQGATGAGYALTLLVINPPLAVASSALMTVLHHPPAITLPRRVPPWVYPLVVAVIARIPRLNESLWYDESFTARMTSIPLENLPVAIMGDVHPPLNYLIQWFAARLLGTSEIALRAPSFVFGVLLVLVVYRLALNIGFGSKFAFTAALLMAVMPAAIYYSNEARQYMLMALLVIGAMTALIEGRRWWFAVCIALLPWTHNIGFVYMAVLCIASLLRYKLWRKFIYTPLLIAIASAGLWLPFMLMQSTDVSNGFWLSQLTLGGVFWPLTSMTMSLHIDDAYVLHTYVPALALTMIATWKYRRWLGKRDGRLLLAVMVGVPALVAFISVVWRPVYLQRALLPCALLLLVLWAKLLIDSRFARVVFVPALAVALISFYGNDRPPLGDYMQSCAGADSVYSTSTAGAFIAGYYLPHQPLYVWSEGNDLKQELSDDAKAAFQFQQLDQPPAGLTCVFYIDAPQGDDQQSQHVTDLLEQHEFLDSTFIEVGYLYHYYFYLIEVSYE